MSLVTRVCTLPSDYFMPVTPAAGEALLPFILVLVCCCVTLLHFRPYGETRRAKVILYKIIVLMSK